MVRSSSPSDCTQQQRGPSANPNPLWSINNMWTSGAASLTRAVGKFSNEAISELLKKQSWRYLSMGEPRARQRKASPHIARLYIRGYFMYKAACGAPRSAQNQSRDSSIPGGPRGLYVDANARGHVIRRYTISIRCRPLVAPQQASYMRRRLHERMASVGQLCVKKTLTYHVIGDAKGLKNSWCHAFPASLDAMRA